MAVNCQERCSFYEDHREWIRDSSHTEANQDPESIVDILNIIRADESIIDHQPYLKIVEEPATRLYRFRYKSEGETAGCIPGERQINGKKSFPKIQICNYEGLARLEVCCLTEDLKVHPNKLVGS